MTDPNFFFELDNNEGFYQPGQIVTGRLVRIVEGPEEQIRYLPLKFQGLGVVYWETTQRQRITDANAHRTDARRAAASGRETYRVSRTHRNQETYFDHTTQLNQQDDGDWITLLPHGRNAFPHLPVGIPASYSHNDVGAESRIFYQAQATYSPSVGSEVIALLNIPVERPLDLNLSPLATQPSLVGREKYLWCCWSGPISFKLTFNKTGFLVGERIDFMAELVNNTSMNIEVIKLWISRTVAFRATDNCTNHDFLEKSIGPVCFLPALSSKQRIEVPVSFDMIPMNYRPINSFGCSFMESSHKLHIKMVIPWAVNLDGSIPIVIGLLPFVPPCESCATFQSQSLALSSFVVP